jgi:hypothetical protein
VVTQPYSEKWDQVPRPPNHHIIGRKGSKLFSAFLCTPTLEMTSAPADAYVVIERRLTDCWNLSYPVRQASRTVGKLFPKSQAIFAAGLLDGNLLGNAETEG